MTIKLNGADVTKPKEVKAMIAQALKEGIRLIK
jgi:hypothetical protein